jgi:hypothetical protein
MSVTLLRRGSMAGKAVAAFAPDQLTNLHAWYKGDGTLWQDSARTTPVTANNDPVGAWDDASGNGYHVLQATAGNRPVYKATGGPNSKPAVNADVAGKYLSKTTGLTNWTGGVTIFIVANTASGGQSNNDYWLGFRTPSDDAAVICGFVTDAVEYFASPRITLGAPHATTYHIFEFVDLGNGAASSAVGLRNGTVTATTTGSSKNLGTAMFLFATNSGAGSSVANFAEVIIYKEGKGTTDRSSVRSYLGTKYGITVS